MMMKSKTPPERLVTKLIKILSEEMRMYNQLLLVLRQKQANIIEGKIEELKSTLTQEQLIIKRAGKTAKVRESSFQELNEALEGAEVKNISQLVEIVETTYAQRLSEIQSSLQQLVKEVSLINEENRYLLDYSIKFVRQAARELIKSSSQFPVYSATGQPGETSGASVIEGKI